MSIMVNNLEQGGVVFHGATYLQNQVTRKLALNCLANIAHYHHDCISNLILKKTWFKNFLLICSELFSQ